MKTFSDLNFKEKMEYIGILAIYPLILLYEQIGKSVKFLNSRGKQITASILTVCLLLAMIPLSAITAFAATGDITTYASMEGKWSGNSTENLIITPTLPNYDTGDGADTTKWKNNWNNVMIPAGWGSAGVSGDEDALQVYKPDGSGNTFAIRPVKGGGATSDSCLGGANETSVRAAGVSYTVKLDSKAQKLANEGVLTTMSKAEFWKQNVYLYEFGLTIMFYDASGSVLSAEGAIPTYSEGSTTNDVTTEVDKKGVHVGWYQASGSDDEYLSRYLSNVKVPAGTVYIRYWFANRGGGNDRKAIKNMQAFLVTPHSTSHTGWTKWSGTKSETTVKTDSNIALSGDTAFSGNLTVGDGTKACTVNLCLNGKTLDMGEYYINNKGTLNICDCKETGKITGTIATDIYSRKGVVTNKGTLTMTSGHISNISENSGEKIAILNDGKTANATITGGKVTSTGAGIYNLNVSSATTGPSLTLGGELVVESGGVAVRNIYGTVDIDGGTYTSSNSDGVANAGSEKFTAVMNITGGNITGEKGISNGSHSDLTISGDTTIIGTDNDGVTNWSKFTFLGGSISVTGSRNGVFNNRKATFVMQGGSIVAENHYCIYNGGGTVDISGGSVTSNTYDGIYNMTDSDTDIGTVTVSGGEITGTQGIYNYSSQSIVNISGGKVTGSSTYGINNGGILNFAGGEVAGHTYGIYSRNGSIYLYGAPTVTAANADISYSSGSIYAHNADSTSAYEGDRLSIYVNNAYAHKDTVIVNDITEGNRDKFSVTNSGYALLLGADENDDDLILHKHEALDDGNCLTAVLCSCGKEMVAAKAEHVSTGDNVATYFAKPVCDECGTEYGEKLVDSTAPTGEIKIKNNGWLQFWNTVTFGLFCKDYVEITITGADAETDVKSIEYYLSDTAIDDEGIKGITAWTAYTGKVRIDAERKVYVYAKITDNAGNVTYLSVNGGIVVFKDTEITTGEYEYTLTTKTDIVTNIKPGNNTVKEIDLCEPGGNAGDSIDFTINANGYIVLDGDDIESVAKDYYAGDYTVTISYNALGEAYGQNAKGDKITDTVITLTVKRFKVEKPTADSTVFTYNGSEQTYAVAESEYYTVGGNKRTNAGEQDVNVALKDTNTFEWADGTTDNLTFKFNIGKASFTAGVKQNGELTYDGREQTATVETTTSGNDAEVSYKYGIAENACDSSAVPAFTNANTYTVYYVASCPNFNDVKGSFEVKIGKKALTVTAKDNTITYGDAPSNNGVNYYGFVLAETETVLKGTLGFEYSYAQYDDIGDNLFTIKPMGLEADNYEITFKEGKLTVNPLKLEFDWKTLSPEDLVYDGNAKKIGTTVKNQVTSGPYDVWVWLEYHGDTKNVTDEGFYAQAFSAAGEKAYNYYVDGTAKSPVYKITKATPETNFPTVLNIDTDKKLSDIDLTGFDGYTWDAPDTAVEYGVHEYSMTFTPADTQNYKTVSKMIKVAGGDITAPTGEITLKNNKWNEFLNNITFGLFFKETQSITITAADTESGVKEIAYYLSAEELSIDDVKALESGKWTVYADAFNVEPDNKYVVYARITDNAGNVIYINSDGIVLDSIKPVIAGVEDGKDVYGDATFTVDEEYLDTVTLDGEPIPVNEGKYSVPADNKEHTIVVTDKTGNQVTYKLTVYKNYKVSFVVDGKEIEASEVGYGKDANLPEIPAKEGYTAAWDVDGKNITADTIITAVYEKIPESPKTGDNTNIWLWAALLMLSGISVFGIGFAKKRKEQEAE